MIKLKKRFRLDKAVSKDEDRLSLQFIKIENDRAVSSNGHILASVPIENAKKRNSLLHPAAWLRAIKKKKGEAYVVEPQEDELLDDTNGFPLWNKVVPDIEKNKKEIRINAKLLLELSQALGESCLSLYVNTSDDYSPIIVKPLSTRFEKDSAFGLIAPIRAETGKKHLTSKRYQE